MEMPDNMQTSNNRIVICLNGEKPDEGLLRTAMENAYIIAADGACRYLCDFGIKADCVVGDFDSFEFDRLSSALRPGGRLIRSIPEKDYTDGQMALKEALDMNPGDIVILGALGGRTDHEQENLRLLCAANENCGISILTRNERIFIISSTRNNGIPASVYGYGRGCACRRLSLSYGRIDVIALRCAFAQRSEQYHA